MSQTQVVAYRRGFDRCGSMEEFITAARDVELTVRPEASYGSKNPVLFEDAETRAGRPTFKGSRFRHSAPYWWDEVLTVPALKIYSLQNSHVFGGAIRSRERPHGFFHSEGQLTLRSDLSLFDSSGGIMDGTTSLPSDLLTPIDDSTFELSVSDAPLRFEGDYYLIGSAHPHFGHFMLEGLSRLWAATALPVDFMKNVKFVVYESGMPPYARECIRLFGIDPSRIIFCPPHATFERLIVPAPSYRSHWWAQPEQVRTWEMIADKALAERDYPYPEKIFLSRRKIKERTLDNWREIEGLFQDAGYKIVCPEDHQLADQIRMAASAKAIAGCVGSGLYLAAFQKKAEVPTIVIGPKSFYLKDDALISDIKGGRLIVALGSETDQSDRKTWRVDPATVSAAVASAINTKNTNGLKVMDSIEKVARALAKLEGENADEIIQGAWDVDLDPDMHFKGKPRWMKYEQEARRFVACSEALS